MDVRRYHPELFGGYIALDIFAVLMPPGAHQRIGLAHLHHLQPLRLPVHAAHGFGFTAGLRVQGLVIRRFDVDHNQRLHHGLPHGFIIRRRGKQPARGGKFRFRRPALPDFKGKDNSPVLPVRRIGFAPIGPGRDLSAVLLAVPRHAEKAAVGNFFAHGGNGLLHGIVRVNFKVDDARARYRTIHKPYLRLFLIADGAAWQRVFQQGDRLRHRRLHPRGINGPARTGQFKRKAVAARSQRHTAVGRSCVRQRDRPPPHN